MTATLLPEHGQGSGDAVQNSLEVHIDHLIPVIHRQVV